MTNPSAPATEKQKAFYKALLAKAEEMDIPCLEISPDETMSSISAKINALKQVVPAEDTRQPSEAQLKLIQSLNAKIKKLSNPDVQPIETVPASMSEASQIITMLKSLLDENPVVPHDSDAGRLIANLKSLLPHCAMPDKMKIGRIISNVETKGKAGQVPLMTDWEETYYTDLSNQISEMMSEAMEIL